MNMRSSWLASSRHLRTYTIKTRNEESSRNLFSSARDGFNSKDRIAGSVPYHTSYTLLQHPLPPSSPLYPSKLDSKFSPLLRELTSQTKFKNGLVNFWHPFESGQETKEVEESLQRQGEEEYTLLVYAASPGSDNVGLRIGQRIQSAPLVSRSTASEVPVLLGRLSMGAVEVSETDCSSSSSPLSQANVKTEDEEILLLVCTHGTRDCRCGNKGGELIRTLYSELESRKKRDASGIWSKVKLGEIAHVGGHKWAANVIAFPWGDWLGNLTANEAPLILDAVYAASQSQSSSISVSSLSREIPPLIVDPVYWRGRMGLLKEEQITFMDSFLTR